MAQQAQPGWVPDTADFGARLALVRWRLGWNVREAERECNISQNLWSNWEHGSMPRNLIEVVNRVVLRTGVNRVWLMTGEGSPEPDQRPTDYMAAGSEALVIDITTRQEIAS